MNRFNNLLLGYLSTSLLSIIFVCCEKDNINDDLWHTVYENEKLDLNSINFLNDTIGFVIGGLKQYQSQYWQYIITTKDGGTTWHTDSCIFPTMDDLLKDVYPVSAQVLIGTGYGIYKSHDSGINWERTSDLTWGSLINDFVLIDSNNWVLLKGKDIFQSSNSGIAWNRVFQTDFMGVFHKFSFPTNDIGYADLGFIQREFNFEISVGKLIKTVDGGKTWEVLNPEPWKSENRQMPSLNSMQFLTNDIGFIVAYAENALYKTTDGGISWNKVNSSIFSRQMIFISEDQGFYYDNNSIYKTNNGGITWRKEREVKVLDWIFLKSMDGFAITNTSKIIKR